MESRLGTIAFRDRRCVVLLALAAALAALAVLYRYPPSATTFYPQCPFYALTGIHCPGCGSTRALAALLHGNVTQALRYNRLFVELLPLGLVYAVAALRRALQPDSYRWPELPWQANQEPAGRTS